MWTTKVLGRVLCCAFAVSFLLASPAVAWETSTLGYWYPLDFATGCSTAPIEQVLKDRKNRLNYDPRGFAHRYGSSPATRFWDMLGLWTNANAFIILTQGFQSGKFIVDAYVYQQDRDQDFTYYNTQYYTTSTWNGFYTIEIKPGGIEHELGMWFTKTASIGAFYSYSVAGSNPQLWTRVTSKERGMVGISGDEEPCWLWDNLQLYVDRMTCGGSAFLDEVGLAAPGVGEQVGNAHAALHPLKRCQNWESIVVGRATPDSIRWQVRDGLADAEYVVRWFSPGGGPPDTVAVVHSSTGGLGYWCGYGVPFLRRAGYGEVLESYHGWVHAASETFSTVDTPAGWSQAATGSCRALSLGPVDAAVDTVQFLSAEGVVTIRLRSALKRSDDTYCGDVVSWMNSAQFGWAEWELTVGPHVRGYLTDQGYNYRVSAYAGSNNPETVKATYEFVAAQNLSYNQSHPGGRQYPAHPLLLIVGTGVLPMSSAGEPDLCSGAECLSYSRITDTDDDGRPDGPVTWIPANSSDGLAQPCNSADEFNSGVYRDPSGAAAVFLGDRSYEGFDDPDWESDGVAALVGAYGGNGHPVRCSLRESAYPSGAATAGQACLETGISDLWIQGLATNPRRLTQFLDPWDHPVTRTQRIMVFAPTCGSLGYWNWEQSEALREMMFPSYNAQAHTLVAGAIGCITAGYAPHHELSRDMLLYEIGRADPGTLYAEIVRRVADDVYDLDPDYARGLLTLGGIVKYPGGMGFSGVADQADRPGTKLRWVRSAGTGGQFQYELDGSWNVELEVFDIQGRRVAKVDAGVRSGHVATGWSPDGLASGLYFGRLNMQRGSESHSWATKVLVAR